LFRTINALSQTVKQPLTAYWKAISILSVLLFALWVPIGFRASAVHDDNLFELGPGVVGDEGGLTNILGDGNAANGPDWTNLFDATPTQAEIDAAVASFGGVAGAFIKDDLSQKGPLDSTTFSGAGGSNKNNDPISDEDCVAQGLSTCDPWHWDAGNVPAKDDLSNLYAYATFTAEGHLILYAGFERLAPEGDSHIDIEFFQSAVALDEAVPCNDPGPDATPCEFEGIRTVGDVIITMDFLQGGAIGQVVIREWNGSEYVVVETITSPQNCDATDTACAFNNGGTIDGGPWGNFDRHGDTITDLEANAFTEFGVDVTALTGASPCISTFMGKTRSSQSFTAELKDFGGPTTFDICRASISIFPDDVNEIGEPHAFTVNVTRSIGTITTPLAGVIVDVTLTDSNGAISNIISETCSTGTDVNGQCTVTFTSNTPGTVTGHASADVTFGSVTKHVETDGVGGNSGDAVKRFVDAFITISTDDTNSVGESHTFTVTVQQNDGSGLGFVDAPDGTIVSVTLTDANGAINTISTDTCASPGTSGGDCSVTFTSQTAGTVTGHASVTFSVAGVSLTRSTDGSGQNGIDAVKVFVSGSLRWSKVDNADQLQGGATFEVCRTHNFNSQTLSFDPITPVCVSVVDDTDGIAGPGLDEDPDAGEFRLTGLRLGRYTVHETVPPPGFAADPDTVTVNLTLASPDAEITEAFRNERPILKLTEFGYTNTPVGTPTSGVVSGITVYTVKIHNYGTATATLDITLMASASGLGSGSFSCTGGNTLIVTGVSVAPGADAMFTLSCEYTNAADGASITATLNATYTLTGLTRTVSGTPATITFTVQSD